MFTLIPKNSNPKELNDEVKKIYEPFMKIIKAPDCVYDKFEIIKLLENSWLREPLVYIYTKLRDYKKALNLLIHDAKISSSFIKAQNYCEEIQQQEIRFHRKIYEIYYECLLNELNTKLEEGDNENKEFKKKLEDEMMFILKKKGSIYNIDPDFVLKNLNDDMSDAQENELYKYIIKSVKNYTNELNKYKITKNLSQVGKILQKKQEYDYKKKYIVIEGDTTCKYCGKKIGNSRCLIYPNMNIYHSNSTCTKNMHIDPLTGIDFRKKKYIE
jgi:hypothetical protein